MNSVHEACEMAFSPTPAADRVISKRWTVEEISAHATPGWIKRKRTAHNEVTLWYGAPRSMFWERTDVRLMAGCILSKEHIARSIRLDTCGWNTPTTCQHMQKALAAHGVDARVRPAGCKVRLELYGGVWFRPDIHEALARDRPTFIFDRVAHFAANGRLD